MPTSHYKQLKKSVSVLRRLLLPAEFMDIPNYTDEIIAKSIAFSIMCHAEMEFYFENVCLEIASKAVATFYSTSKSNVVTASLLAFSGKVHPDPPFCEASNTIRCFADM